MSCQRLPILYTAHFCKPLWRSRWIFTGQPWRAVQEQPSEHRTAETKLAGVSA